MNGANNIISITSQYGTQCIELESFVHQEVSQVCTIEDVIRHYNSFLDKLSIPRAKINELKKTKDKIVKEYIFKTQAPSTLDLELINYKALLFYFKDSFIKRSLSLSYSNYATNDVSQIQRDRQNSLVNYFCNGELDIKLTFNNFPHLIGIRRPTDSSGNVVNHNYIDEFLDDIFYETKLIEDYRSHRGDENKIKTFSWIYATLSFPTMILEEDAIRGNRSNFKSDLIFVRKLYGDTEYSYHVVGVSKQDKCSYFIQSQFPVKTDREFHSKFNQRKKIYQKSRGGRS